MNQLLELVRQHPWLIIPFSLPEIYVLRKALGKGGKKGKVAKAPKVKKEKLLSFKAKLAILGVIAFFIWAYAK